jgi:hypothetical protein
MERARKKKKKKMEMVVGCGEILVLNMSNASLLAWTFGHNGHTQSTLDTQDMACCMANQGETLDPPPHRFGPARIPCFILAFKVH